MTRSVGRRQVVTALAGVAAVAGLAGCTGNEGSATRTTTRPETAGVERREAVTALLRSNLERRGLEVRNVTVGADTIVVRAQTTGNVTEDMRIAGGVYATQADVFERNLTVRVEDRGLYEAEFEVEREWATRVANGRMSDRAYLERINATRPERRRS